MPFQTRSQRVHKGGFFPFDIGDDTLRENQVSDAENTGCGVGKTGDAQLRSGPGIAGGDAAIIELPPTAVWPQWTLTPGEAFAIEAQAARRTLLQQRGQMQARRQSGPRAGDQGAVGGDGALQNGSD